MEGGLDSSQPVHDPSATEKFACPACGGWAGWNPTTQKDHPIIKKRSKWPSLAGFLRWLLGFPKVAKPGRG
jgi:hypothetical protein